jgi:autotransporter translocation and assembly factor TamB
MPAPWLNFEGRLPAAITATGAPSWVAERGVDLVLSSDGEVDLAPLSTLIPAIARSSGRAEIIFSASGDPTTPELSGTVVVHDGIVRARDTLEEFREFELAGHFADGAFHLDEATARQGEKGEISIDGEIPFKGLVPDDVLLTADVSRVLLLSVPALRAIVSSVGPLSIVLERPMPQGPRIPVVRGSAIMDRAIYRGEFEPQVEGGGAVLQATSTPPWMAEIELELSQQIRISNSVAELHVGGDVDFVRDLSGLRLRGQAEISQGRVSVASLLDFEITSGRLDFSRGTTLEPQVDITAETEVPVYDSSGVGRDLELVTVLVTGTFSEPELSFQSQTGYDQKTIIKLLAGIPLDSGAEAAQIQDLALRFATNELGGALADRIGLIDTVDVSTTESGAASFDEARIGLGKYLDVADKPLYLRYSQGLSVAEFGDVYLEYQLRRRFLLSFELRRRLRESVTHTEVNADLKFRVEY